MSRAREPWCPVIAGVSVKAPAWANYVACDADGIWLWFERRPEADLSGNERDWIWQISEGKCALVFKQPSDWTDSLSRRPDLIGKSEQDRRGVLIRNAVAQYQFTLGKIVHVRGGNLIGIVSADGKLEWTKKHIGGFFEIVETDESEVTRFKGNLCAPYWKAIYLGAHANSPLGAAKHVLIRLPRNGIDGELARFEESSFSYMGDIIFDPSSINPDFIPVYFARHPDFVVTERGIHDESIRISEIVWDGSHG